MLHILAASLLIAAALAAPIVIDYLSRNCPGRNGGWIFSTKGR